MCIDTIEPNKPLYTLIRLHQGDRQILTHRNRPILTTDQDALIIYAAARAKMNPTATYFISRLINVMEI